MMATTLVPPSATPSPAPSPARAAGEVRFVAVRANLMPDEVLSARQVVVVRKQVLLGLVVVLVLLIGWFGLSWWQTRSANDDLADAQRQGIALQSQQTQFTPLVQAQAQITNIRTELQQVMVGDLSWKTMINDIRSKAPAGISFATISGSIASGSGSTSAGGSDVLNQTGSASVGTLTIQGGADSKRTIAAYADALSNVRGLAAPLIAAVDAHADPITFTITAVITTDALGGRYTSATDGTGTPSTTTGGN
jgi:Tfp pilus assembly protein PilN